MEEQNVEQTTENPTEEATVEQQTSNVEQETTIEPEKPQENLEAKNRQLFERAKKAEIAKKDLEKEVERLRKVSDKTSMGIDDYIEISASLDGLDQREKEKLAREHKLTGIPIKELRQSEDFTLWQKAYKEKIEKEKQTLTPSSTQSEVEKPKTIEERLSSAKSFEERGKILEEFGFNPLSPHKGISSL